MQCSWLHGRPRASRDGIVCVTCPCTLDDELGPSPPPKLGEDLAICPPLSDNRPDTGIPAEFVARRRANTCNELPLAGFDRVRQLWSHLEQVANDPIIGDLEDRRLFVLVDGNDRLAGLHSCTVL